LPDFATHKARDRRAILQLQLMQMEIHIHIAIRIQDVFRAPLETSFPQAIH
jgi:hypothetical protein